MGRLVGVLGLSIVSQKCLFSEYLVSVSIIDNSVIREIARQQRGLATSAYYKLTSHVVLNMHGLRHYWGIMDRLKERVLPPQIQNRWRRILSLR